MARILLIDDNEDLRVVLRLALVHLGHIVIEARNGKEGLELFPQAGADLVITDLVMPDGDGIEVLQELRKKEAPVKIIAITGGGRTRSDDSLKLARELGAAKVLAKPFSYAALTLAINELLPAAQTTSQPGAEA